MDTQLEEIKGLMQKAGLSEDVAKGICDSMSNYIVTREQKLNEDLAAKIDRAKKVCVEETENHKVELSRRLQVWCESTKIKLENNISKNTAVRHTEATALLGQIKDLVHGMPVGGDAALVAECKKLKTANKTLAEECKKARLVAERNHKLADKVMKRNRILESKQTETVKPIVESTVAETTQKPGQQNGNRQAYNNNRIQARKSKTTRTTLNEHQNRQQPKDTRTNNIRTMQNGGNQFPTPDAIGNMIEEGAV